MLQIALGNELVRFGRLAARASFAFAAVPFRHRLKSKESKQECKVDVALVGKMDAPMQGGAYVSRVSFARGLLMPLVSFNNCRLMADALYAVTYCSLLAIKPETKRVSEVRAE